MGQKVHPTGIRLGIVKDHTSIWYADNKHYAKQLITDLQARAQLPVRPAEERGPEPGPQTSAVSVR